jgi:hypothetical protein
MAPAPLEEPLKRSCAKHPLRKFKIDGSKVEKS